MKLVAPSDPVLLGHAEPVVFPDPSLASLVSDMTQLMLGQRGCGLAAPQVGIPLRVFTFRVDQTGVAINPVIIYRGLEQIDFKEGCLTFPGKLYRTRRSKMVSVSYLDIAGNRIRADLDGLMAIVFQHETDHLDGRLISQHGKEET